VTALDLSEELKDSILISFDVEKLRKTVSRALELGVDPLKILNSLNEALDQVGKRYESGEYFLSELMMAGVLATEATTMLEPYLVRAGRKSLGKVLFGTVKGDIHDIGKNIVIMLLRAAGFDVVDLGVDVSAQTFANTISNENANVLGLSALLTSTMYEMKNVIDTIKKRQLRNQVKIVVGGRPVTKEFAEEIGADGYAEDAIKAVRVCKELVGVAGE